MPIEIELNSIFPFISNFYLDSDFELFYIYLSWYKQGMRDIKKRPKVFQKIASYGLVYMQNGKDIKILIRIKFSANNKNKNLTRMFHWIKRKKMMLDMKKNFSSTPLFKYKFSEVLNIFFKGCFLAYWVQQQLTVSAIKVSRREVLLRTHILLVGLTVPHLHSILLP